MFLSLVSGSSGNSTLISDGRTTLLADCGLSCKKLEQAMETAGVKPESLNGILITHEHSDHVKGVGVVSRKYNLPVYATLGTHANMNLSGVDERNIKYISPDVDFEIGTIGVRPFSIPHDAADPIGFNFFFGEKKLSLATDIGKMNDYIFDCLKNSMAVILESNHDTQMLRTGRYPAVLKKRILSDFGHLSNDDAAKTVCELIKNGTKYVMLGHLSNENNTPTKAYTKTAEDMERMGAVIGKDVALSLAGRFGLSCFKCI